MAERPITVAILAIGGQGGGVVSDWIVRLAERSGWYAQSTSVPGVAQRTGATIYYIEMLPESGRQPVMALMPAPGDVDIVIAAELMEAGRAMQRGFVTPDRTTLIASSHRAYAVQEKAAPGDGIADSGAVIAAARTSAKRFICLDLQAIAEAEGSVISASLFGALAASGALPFPRAAFEQTIRDSGKGVAASLRAFGAAHDAADRAERAGTAATSGPDEPAATPVVPAGGSEADRAAFAALLARAEAYPAPVAAMAVTGLRHVVDFQDLAYGEDYLERIDALLRLEAEQGGAVRQWRLGQEGAKYLARAMAYDDVIRVADLKTRESRLDRVRQEVGARADQVLHVTEFMHPRMAEMCGTLPVRLGRAIEGRPALFRRLDRLVNRGRRVRTDTLFWFFALYALAGLKRYRRALLRHAVERAHLERWLAEVHRLAGTDYDLAVEVLRCRRLIKGYSDTHARGESKFDRVLSALPMLEGRADAADWLRRLREAALKDEEGTMLDGALRTVASLEADGA